MPSNARKATGKFQQILNCGTMLYHLLFVVEVIGRMWHCLLTNTVFPESLNPPSAAFAGYGGNNCRLLYRVCSRKEGIRNATFTSLVTWWIETVYQDAYRCTLWITLSVCRMILKSLVIPVTDSYCGLRYNMISYQSCFHLNRFLW